MRTSTIKSIAAVALTGVGSALVLGFRTSDELTVTTTAHVNASGSTSTTATGTASSSASTGSTSAASGSAPAASGSTSDGSMGATAAAYADGTWTGDAVREPWGSFQVAVVITDGSISSVSVVESPSDRHSSSINSQAVPLLTESVLASQGTNVDMVSGATWTSESYSESLQSALDEAAQAA